VSDSYVVRRSVQHDVVHNITMLGTQFVATKTRADAEYFMSYLQFYNQQHDHVPRNKTSKDSFFENSTLPVAILTFTVRCYVQIPLYNVNSCVKFKFIVPFFLYSTLTLPLFTLQQPRHNSAVVNLSRENSISLTSLM